jgi:hypothetical protein
VEADDPELKASIERAFRLEWFRAVAQIRVPAETGLVARSVPGVTVGGYDPAANYRRFPEQIERLVSHSAD